MAAGRFECGPIREWDDAGALRRAGAFWTEGTRQASYNRAAGLVFAIIGVGLVTAGFMSMGAHGPFALAYWLFALPALIAAGVLIAARSRRRQMIFTSDDRTLTPLGLSAYAQADWPLVPPSAFASIGVDADAEGVMMHDGDGVIRPIARGLHRQAALAVAAELEQALIEIRSASRKT